VQELEQLLTFVAQIQAGLRQIQAGLDFGARLERTIREWVLAPLRGSLHFIIDTTSAQSGGSFTADRTIQHWEPLVEALSEAALVAVVAWAFYRVMFAHGSFTQYTARIMLPRFVVAFVVIHFSLPLLQGAVDLSNRLSEAVVAVSLQSDMRGMVDQWGREMSLEGGLGPVIALSLLVGFLLLTFVYTVRYALLVVLAILAPLAALLLVLPETKRYAHEWASLFVTTLLMQPLQLFVLGVGLSLEEYGSSPLRHAFALAALWMCFKVPGALRTASAVGSHAESFVHRHAAQLARAATKAAVKAAV
jgi:hypothetical protein